MISLIKEITPPILWRILVNFKNAVKPKPKSSGEDLNILINRLNISQDEECIILGNGPSLNETLKNSIEFFDNKTKFCVNSFANSDFYQIIKPKFYVFADPVFWNKNNSEESNKLVSEIYRSLEEKTKWNLIIFLPHYAKEWNVFKTLVSNREQFSISYYNSTRNNSISSNQFKLYNSNIETPIFQNVLIASIFISLNLGFKKNYIVGADMSLHESVEVNEDSVVCVRPKHFNTNTDSKLSYFYKDGSKNKTFKMSEIFNLFQLTFRGFDILEEYSKFLNSKIYNASVSTYIDSFERYKI